MSTIPAMRKAKSIGDTSSFEDLAYVISGKHTEISSAYASVGIILLHDSSRKNISIRNALEHYTAIYSDKILFAYSNSDVVPANIRNMFPNVYFFHTAEGQQNPASVGALLNTLFSEIHTDLVFVSWTHIEPYGISTRMLLHAVEDMPLCVAPLCEDSNGNPIPVSYKPKITMWGISMNLDRNTSFFSYTFFPHDFVGIFNRKKVCELQGFDANILNPFWQLCDFAIRAYGSGHYVRVSSCFRVKHVTNTKRKRRYKKDYMYHYMCLKYAVGLRIVHTVQSLLLFFSGQHGIKFYKKYDTTKNIKSTTLLKNVLKKKITEYW